jgi:hypothetical protein
VAGIFAVALAVLVMGCAHTHVGPDAQTADVQLGSRRFTVALDVCERVQGTVYLVGHGGGLGMQAVVDVRPVPKHKDTWRAVPAATAITFDSTTTSIGAIGPQALARMHGTGPAPGHVESASLTGARVQINAQAEHLGAGHQATGNSAGHLYLDAYCPQQSGGSNKS